LSAARLTRLESAYRQSHDSHLSANQQAQPTLQCSPPAATDGGGRVAQHQIVLGDRSRKFQSRQFFGLHPGVLPIWNRQQQNTGNLPRNAVGYVNQPREVRNESYHKGPWPTRQQRPIPLPRLRKIRHQLIRYSVASRRSITVARARKCAASLKQASFTSVTAVCRAAKRQSSASSR
jgi:hypothetical protein